MDYRFMRYPGGKTKAVILSYDDGSKHDIPLMEIINRYGMKCTLNIHGHKHRAGKGLTFEQIQTFLDQGHEVAVHGDFHRSNALVRPVEGIRDVLDCRDFLEETFGRIIRGMAYPDTGLSRFTEGHNYETVRNYLQSLGIVYVRTVGDKNPKFDIPGDWYAWMPTAHHADPMLPGYMDEFVSLDVDSLYKAFRHPRLLFIWGHSHEFHRNKNWDLLESICEKLGGREDIWYTTSIDLFEYVNAYYALVWSSNGKRVYNPTLFTIWFAVGPTMYTIAPGETLTIEYPA